MGSCQKSSHAALDDYDIDDIFRDGDRGHISPPGMLNLPGTEVFVRQDVTCDGTLNETLEDDDAVHGHFVMFDTEIASHRGLDEDEGGHSTDGEAFGECSTEKCLDGNDGGC